MMQTSAAAIRPRPKVIRNPLALILLWASKSDRRLVSVCSRWARSTQAAFGLFVLFTTALALGAAYYTLSTLGVPAPWPTWIAMAWSIFVLFLDREIVGGLDKATALVRPLLALVIGIIVSTPIELFIFEKRIDQQLARQYRDNNKEQLQQIRSAQSQIGDRRAALQATLAQLRQQEIEWGKVMDDELVGRPKPGRTGLSGPGPVFENAENQQEEVRQRMQEIRQDLEHLEQTLPEERQRLQKEFQREEISKVTNFVTRYEALQDVIHSSDALYRLSWGVTLFFILLEMTPALMKILTPHVDYHHLVNAEIRENIARIDEIADRNYRLAIENPETPELSVSEKFARVRYMPVQVDEPLAKPSEEDLSQSESTHAA